MLIDSYLPRKELLTDSVEGTLSKGNGVVPSDGGERAVSSDRQPRNLRLVKSRRNALRYARRGVPTR